MFRKASQPKSVGISNVKKLGNGVVSTFRLVENEKSNINCGMWKPIWFVEHLGSYKT